MLLLWLLSLLSLVSHLVVGLSLTGASISATRFVPFLDLDSRLVDADVGVVGDGDGDGDGDDDEDGDDDDDGDDGDDDEDHWSSKVSRQTHGRLQNN